MLARLKALTVGLELEVTGGAREAVSLAYDRGLVASDYLHSYHCSCSDCEPDIDRATIATAQNDCTVDGEFITRPMFMGDTESWAQMERLAVVFAASGTYADPMESTGCHVHVGAEGLDLLDPIELEDREWCGRERLAQFFVPLQNDIGAYARGASHRVRGYNSPIGSSPRYRTREGWLHLRKGSPTVEFRLWNGTTAAWRWKMYAGISAAIVLATMEGRPPCPDGTTLVDALDGLLDGEMLELMERQMTTPF